MPQTTLSPLPPKDWPESLDEMQNSFAAPLNVYRLMAHHPALLKAWAPLRAHVVAAEALGAERQEVVVLRVAHKLNSAYEATHHDRRARALGFDSTRIESLKGPYDLMRATDVALARAVDEVLETGRVSAELRATLLAEFGPEAVLDLMATVGFYLTLGAMVNSFEVAADDLGPPTASDVER